MKKYIKKIKKLIRKYEHVFLTLFVVLLIFNLVTDNLGDILFIAIFLSWAAIQGIVNINELQLRNILFALLLFAMVFLVLGIENVAEKLALWLFIAFTVGTLKMLKR